MLLIERLQVEDGFLDALDVKLSPGLNVVIGPRGVGKTSIIELIRFCFGLEPITQAAARDARQHALSILGSRGQVTVTALLDGDRLQITRGADDLPEGLPIRERPIVLSQSEIEAIGVDAVGRLRILDGFLSEAGKSQSESLNASIRSRTVQLQHLAIETEGLRAQIRTLSDVANELQSAEAEQAEVAKTLKSADAEQRRLAQIADEQAAHAAQRGVIERVLATLSEWRGQLAFSIQSAPVVEDWPVVAGPNDALGEVRQHVADALRAVHDAEARIATAEALITGLLPAIAEAGQELVGEARDLRQRLDAIQQGAGSASRRVAQLRERLGQEAALKSLLQQKRRLIDELQVSRGQLLDQVDALTESRYRQREAIAKSLRERLGPRIDVQVLQDAATASYSSAIASALRGSGLHYNTLAPVLSEHLAPRELAEAIERGNSVAIASIADISDERATRLVEHLREGGTADILTAEVDDAVELLLLDGKEYKSTAVLSTGQRCTVILPILLAHEERLLIVDEPEAHLDNAFIVSTLIQAIRARPRDAQLILATHNANIPVLGDARQVISLGSDGGRGFVRHAGDLTDPEIVDAITTVMEGGRDAFRRRAAFYDRYPETA